MSEIKHINEKTVIFNCPLIKNILVRTGVDLLKNTLIQCILLATDKTYLKEVNKRDQIYNQICNKLCRVKTLKTNVLKVFNDFYDSITKNEKLKLDILSSDDTKQVFSIIFEMIGFAEFKDIIKSNYPNIQTYRENVLEGVSNIVMNCLKDLEIDDKRKDYCKKKSKELFHNIFKYCEKLELTDNNILDYYSHLNILYIDSTTKLPLKTTNNTFKEDTIIMLKYSDNTYEVIGKLYKNNVVTRMFSSSDNICKLFIKTHKRSSSSSNDRHKRSSSSSNDRHKRSSSSSTSSKPRKPRKIIDLFKSSSEN